MAPPEVYHVVGESGLELVLFFPLVLSDKRPTETPGLFFLIGGRRSARVDRRESKSQDLVCPQGTNSWTGDSGEWSSKRVQVPDMVSEGKGSANRNSK